MLRTIYLSRCMIRIVSVIGEWLVWLVREVRTFAHAGPGSCEPAPN